MTRVLRTGDLRCPASGKAAYASETEAERHMEIAFRRGYERPKVPARVYECPDCGWWHLTASPKWEER